MSQLFSTIYLFCDRHGLIKPHATIIVGLSGGPDSVFLLQYLTRIAEEKNLTLIAAHLDHEWRSESAHDARFCQELAADYKVPCVTKTMSECALPFKFNGSKEEWGRKARRAFFEAVAAEHHASAIALAHHADDQAETFFMRMIRGASLSGLAGMKPRDGLYIRPLLQIRKEEILQHLHEHQTPYLIDASNQSPEYLRNRIRNTVMPALRACDERFEKNFAATHAQLAQTEEFLQQYTAAIMHEVTDAQQGLDIQKLLALHPVVRNRVLIQWLIMHKVPFTPSQGLLDEMVRFLENSKNRRHTIHQKWALLKHNNRMILKNLTIA